MTKDTITVLREVLSETGMQKYLNGVSVQLSPEDLRDIIAAAAAAPAAIQPAGEAMAAQVCLSEQNDEWALITLADCERMRRLGIPVRLLYAAPVSAPVHEAKAEQVG